MSDDDRKLSRRQMFSFWRRGPEPNAAPGGPRPADADPAPAGEAAPAPPGPPPGPPPALPAPAPLDPLRPPGAIAEPLFIDQCTRCGDCVAACPAAAIVLAADTLPDGTLAGRTAGTPIIVPRRAACVVCDGLRCTRACPSGVLLKIAPFDVQLGTAVVDPHRCAPFAGRPCTACSSACPVPGALGVDDDGAPVVDESLCVGCGVCEQLCPEPVAAIRVEPARELIR